MPLTLSQGNLDSQDHCIKEAPVIAETHNINEQAPTQLHWEEGGLEWTTHGQAGMHRVHQSQLLPTPSSSQCTVLLS